MLFSKHPFFTLLLLTFSVFGGCDRPAAPESKQETIEADRANDLQSPEVPDRQLTSTSLYVNSEYDESRSPQSDLDSAIQIAAESDRKIILQIGGSWCSWCIKLHKAIDSNEVARQKLQEAFIIVKVATSSDTSNEAFLAQFPAAESYPHWIVLDADGAYLHSQDMEEFELADSYNLTAISDFAEQWSSTRSAVMPPE